MTRVMIDMELGEFGLEVETRWDVPSDDFARLRSVKVVACGGPDFRFRRNEADRHWFELLDAIAAEHVRQEDKYEREARGW